MIRVITVLTNLLISLSAGAGVKATDLALDLSADLSGSAELSSEQLSHDLQFLAQVSRRAYAGPDLGVFLQRISRQPTGSQGFCDRLAAGFQNVRDAHLRVSLEFQSCGPASAKGQVGKNLAEQGSWVLSSEKASSGAYVDVLAIPTFWSRYDDQHWQGFLETVRELRRKGRPFILDLRGNWGGDDSMGFELARVFLSLGDFVNLPSPIASRNFIQTPEAFAVQANQMTWSILRLQKTGQPVPEFLRQRREEILSWMTRAENHQFPERYVEHLPDRSVDQREIFKEKIYVLIDRECISSCETTLQALESLPGRVLIGESTKGAVEFGEVGKVVLPHSRVVVSLSTMSVHFRDGRKIEKVGYKPDLQVPPGGNALDEALKLF